MTRKLLFLRHGKSSWSDPYLSDHDRPLASRGKKNAPQMAIIQLGKAFRNFFSRRAKYPKFRKQPIYYKFRMATSIIKWEKYYP